jgi:PAS domain S-box-containing protein
MSVKSNKDPRPAKELLEEIEQLRSRLEEAEQTLDAIRSGDVDALVVTGPHGDQIFSLTGAELTYRLIVETMNEAALTVGFDGTILYCNQRFCDLVKKDMPQTVGEKLSDFIEPSHYPQMLELLAEAKTRPAKMLLKFHAIDGTAVSVQIAASLLIAGDLISICLVATDLTELETQSNSIRDMLLQKMKLEASRAELQLSNSSLRDSRLAGLNILEDTVAAHREIERTSVDLKKEITERRRVEKELQKAHDEMDLKVRERTRELLETNELLTQEIAERKKAKESLLVAYSEIKRLKEKLEEENIHLQQEVASQYNFGEIVGRSDLLTRVFTLVEKVAPMNATVLLLGETGTGKGVIARAIHSRSSRKGRPLITVDCTTLPATLVESELFGRERGAYTGSDTRQVGRFELADGGTIFLDEIGEMPLELQSKLLRVIQDGEFERLGSPRTIKTDVRIIAATNRNLGDEVKNGKFREDLYYRLNVFPITMPPLRQRKDDIPLLISHFVAKFNKKIGKKIVTVSKELQSTLQEYHWPGNVRELESVIERAVIISQGPALQVLDRFDTFKKTEAPSEGGIKALVELEHDHVLQVLQKTGWRIEGKNGAAVLLGLNASTLRARMRKYGIVRQ